MFSARYYVNNHDIPYSWILFRNKRTIDTSNNTDKSQCTVLSERSETREAIYNMAPFIRYSGKGESTGT